MTPRPLETDEIPGLIEDYRLAAHCALAAGFDGVEIHAANGYLIEQFLRDSTNLRSDIYGGALQNRARLLLEVTEAVSRECGGDRVGIRLSPVSPVNDIGPDSDPTATYGYTVEQLNAFGLSYIHVIEGATQGPRDAVPFDYQALRRSFKGFYIANNGYDRALAQQALAQGQADLIAFGRAFIANPDLVERLRIGARLAEPHRETLYGGGREGYSDYPPSPHPGRTGGGAVRAGMTMRALALSKVYRLIEPGPVLLMTTARKGRANVMTMSWHTMLDFEPPLIACVIGEGDYSFAALKTTRQCVLAIPAAQLASKVVKIGNCHGDQIDKFKAFGLTPLPAATVAAPLIGECFANLECKVVDSVRRYDLFVLEVVKAWTDPAQRSPQMLHHQGYGKFAVDGRTIRLPSRMR